MNRRMAVTRTFSIGTCSASDRQDIQSARRHSLVGMRALMWSTHSSSLGWERVTSKDNILSNVVTPNSIPQFTIPRLAVEDSAKCTGHNRERSGEEDDADIYVESFDETGNSTHMSTSLSSSSSSSSGSSSPGSGSSPAISRKACRSISDPYNLNGTSMQRDTSREAQQHYDPDSCVSLSLPHLPKVTTPYGFIMLSQSPKMASEEALLFQAGPSRRWSRLDEVSAAQRHIKPEPRKALSSSQSQPSTSIHSASQKPPTPLLQGTGRKRAEGVTAPKLNYPDTRTSQSKPKSRLWGILRKQFISQKGLQRHKTV